MSEQAPANGQRPEQPATSEQRAREGPEATERRLLAGSERRQAPGAAGGVPVDPAEEITITVVLRRRNPLPAESTNIPREQFIAEYGADPADVDKATATLTRLGARIDEVDLGSRRLRVTGSVGTLSRLFGTRLEQVTSIAPSGQLVSHRHRTGALSIPAELDGIVTAVLGLDDRPQARAMVRPALAAAVRISYTPPQLGNVYSFPPGTDGSGHTIAILELAGGFDQADLDAYFGSLGINPPSVTAVGVDGASNQPGQDPTGADREVLMDIEVAGALAPGADFQVYFAPSSDAGFLDALCQAVLADPTPIAISISWGASEDLWTEQAGTAFDRALADAAVLGITVTVAAGDDGSGDFTADGRPHVDFPAASPHALACGGTSLIADPTTGQVSSETVWNNGVGSGATGGGVSDSFALPSWQSTVGVPRPGRGVPDVAANADPHTGYRVRVDGTDDVMGGTSAVAPLWAALIARLAQATGRRFGLIQPALYGNTVAGAVAAGFRDVTSGTNGAYAAGPGWDACTGLGVPNGTELLAVLDG